MAVDFRAGLVRAPRPAFADGDVVELHG